MICLNHKMVYMKWIFFIVLILLGGSIFYLNKDGKQTKIENKKIEFEILDESVLSNDTFKDWINNNKKGNYIKEDDDCMYVMISYGETKKQGIGICLEEVKGSTNNTEIVYSIIESNTSESIGEEYTPKMVLKLNKTKGKIKFTEIKS